jgi:hypothetical protein
VTETATKDWKEVMRDIIAEARSVDPSLLVLDTFQAFAGLEGEEENSSGPVKKRLQDIKYICSHCGMAAIIVHHDRKSGGPVVKAGRGSSAFQAVSDQILSLRQPSGDWKNNVRRLKAAGRYSGVPSERMIKLEDDGYVIADDDSKQGKLDEAIVHLLPNEEPDALEVSEVKSDLEERDFKRGDSTIRRHLENLLENDRVAKVGSGNKGDPHRYYASLPPFPGANPDDSG